jgi:hypothetical protein
MLLAIDTSVIVAGALAGHVFHPRAHVWQAAIHRGEVQAMVCAHALAEVYSVFGAEQASWQIVAKAPRIPVTRSLVKSVVALLPWSLIRLQTARGAGQSQAESGKYVTSRPR